ncbi:MAG TPA: NAD(P)/FAD-dependent oxidoreductase [Verrucomicrobiae bacterium]|nr:NAD(P)/FAD-dependent oxidoreductase [Verrucomicrobiae bacterium]
MAGLNSIRTVGIIGSGPAGATLASLLTMKGVDVTVFDDGRRPDLIVGESLIPAIVPVLRKLNLEERTAAICQHKPGVTFTFSPEEQVAFCFESLSGSPMPTYAYNAPRPAFDNLLDQRATELGVKRARVRAKIERVNGTGLQLAAETLEHAPWFHGRQPDLLVDSTGRGRLFARTLEIPAEVGPRKDVAYFAHYEGFADPTPRGQVIIGRLARGWCWRIPLRDCLSVGVVMNKDDAAPFGATPEERLEGVINHDPLLAAAGQGRRRVTEIATYTNYQLVSRHGHGPGWVMTGDALGFVDPMLSPGMWLALHSAELLAERLDNLPAYTREMRKLIKAWMGLIQYFYDGRIFAMYKTGMFFEQKFPGRISETMHDFFNRKIACMASGLTTTSRFGHGMLQIMSRPAAWKTDPATLAIH